MKNVTNKLSFTLKTPDPLLIVISGLSGAGKDSVIDALLKLDIPLDFVVTATSRPPRHGEKDGVDYLFVSKSEFENMITNGELIEYALVYDQYKGVPKKNIEKALQSKKDALLRVDVQGAKKVKEIFPNAVLIFIMPEDENSWNERLRKRKTDTEEQIQIRLKTAQEELEYLPLFDYMVINPTDNIKKAVNTILCIINTEHQKVKYRI